MARRERRKFTDEYKAEEVALASARPNTRLRPEPSRGGQAAGCCPSHGRASYNARTRGERSRMANEAQRGQFSVPSTIRSWASEGCGHGPRTNVAHIEARSPADESPAVEADRGQL